MADESLKHLYDGIEASEEEMRVYRARLASKLARPRRPRLWIPLGAAAVVAAALLLWLLPSRTADLSGLNLDQVLALAQGKPAAVLREAGELAHSGKGSGRWNANMLLCLTAPEGEAIRYAARGVEEDPRPQFRSRYLELLLDDADQQRFRPDSIERLMDREYDGTCLELYRELVRIAQLQEHYLGPPPENSPFDEASHPPTKS